MADSKCNWVRQELAEVRRGRASTEMATRVEAHLGECAACQAEAKWDERLAGSLTPVPAPAAADHIESQVWRLVRRRRWLRGAAIGTAAAAIIGVSSLAFLDSQRVLPTPSTTQSVQAPSEAAVMKELTVAVNNLPVDKPPSQGGQAMSVMLLSLIMAQAQADPPASQLTPEQVTRLRTLVKETQDKATALAAQLEAKERELAQVYGEYEFRERRAFALEAEIVDLQRQKLANYHEMHVELRTIVGKERFDVLKQRLRLAGFFGPAPKTPDRK